MSPSLYWQIKHLIDDVYNETLEAIKIFYEILAAQIGCGLSLGHGIELVVAELSKEKKLVSSLKNALDQIALEVKIGLFSEDSFKPITALSKVALMEKFNELMLISLKTGSPIDQLLIHFADLLSDLLKHKREFQQRLSQKKSEFHIMMLMPIGAIISIREMMPDYFSVLYETSRGMLLLVCATILYSFSCHLFYFNESKFQSEGA